MQFQPPNSGSASLKLLTHICRAKFVTLTHDNIEQAQTIEPNDQEPELEGAGQDDENMETNQQFRNWPSIQT